MFLIRILIVLFALSICTSALYTHEELALSEIYESVEGLRRVSPPWRSNVSAACEHPVFYGITCSEGPNPHVIGLYVHINSGLWLL